MERDIRKDKVIANFSRAAATYDGAADIQRRAAEHLAAIVRDRCPDAAALSPFLEIGAGTGFLTGQLLRLGLSQGMVTDVAPTMVAGLRRNYAALSGITVRELDGEQFALGERFNAVFSASTFQWFPSLLDPFRNIRRHLMRGGLFAFCLFVDGTFRELRQVVNAVGCPYPGHRLFEANEVVRAMLDGGFSVEHCSTLDLPAHYPDALRFFRSIRAIGSTSAAREPLGPRDLRRVISRYDADHRRADGVTATYTTLFVLGHKKGSPESMIP